MRSASTAFRTEINKEVSSLIRLLEIKTRSGQEYFMTDSDIDITFENKVFKNTEGFISSAIQTEAGSGMQSLTVEFALSPQDSSVNRRKVYEATMDSADISIRTVNRLNLPAGAVTLFVGRVDKIEFDDLNNVKFEIIGRVESGQSSLIIEQYSPLCRADFGDPRCKVLLSDHSLDFTIESSPNSSTLISEILQGQEDGHWSFGFVEFTSGRNIGIIIEVSYHVQSTGSVILHLPIPGKVEVGDTACITRGCDKTTDNCKVYSNILNFRGEPFPPSPEVDETEEEE